MCAVYYSSLSCYDVMYQGHLAQYTRYTLYSRPVFICVHCVMIYDVKYTYAVLPDYLLWWQPLSLARNMCFNLSATRLSSFCIQVNCFHPRAVVAYFPLVISFRMQERGKLLREVCEADELKRCKEGSSSNYHETWPETCEEFIVRHTL
jgi:hypothetical protein